MESYNIKVILNGVKYPIVVTQNETHGDLWLSFGYNAAVIGEIKTMEGAKWHGFDDTPIRQWSIKNSLRNHFRLAFLMGKNPYESYDHPVKVPIDFCRPLYHHQKLMVAHCLSNHYVILACEMGTGKTLAAIETMERVNPEGVWYVGPRSGVEAVTREISKWRCAVQPEMYTYERIVKILLDWSSAKPPQMVVIDECSKIKTPSAQRSQAIRHLVGGIKSQWGSNGYAILMSGTPAPRDPTDWWHQCEVACPGYLREGNIHHFKRRLALIEERESLLTGGKYPHLVTWLDDSNKCAICGQFEDGPQHIACDHPFTPSINEVEKLYKRMRGLVLVQFKKDCLDLPEKRYQELQVQPTVEMIRACKLIQLRTTRAIQALTLLRELSDGFQYTTVENGDQLCSNCGGTGIESAGAEITDTQAPLDVQPQELVKTTCSLCNGGGRIPAYTRATQSVSSPKDQVFIDLLDEHEDTGRFIVWGGFTGTIDRLVEIAHKYGWFVLRVDGRGYMGTSPTDAPVDYKLLLAAMDLSDPDYKKNLEAYPKLCFIGHPQAGGMALTLTASPTELFFSNCFSGEARMQAEDRFHRVGMDTNRGATIIDLICLKSDKLVLENLKRKRRLQNLSMGELQEAFK